LALPSLPKWSLPAGSVWVKSGGQTTVAFRLESCETRPFPRQANNYLFQIGPFAAGMRLAARARGAAVTGEDKAKAASEIEKIEETQEALRDTIEQARRLAEQAKDLLQQHKKNLQNDT
jgi:hypothetical protein